jgi:hypothetical protein
VEKFKIEPWMESAPGFAQRATMCPACRVEIPAGEPLVWVVEEGCFHERCVEREPSGE